MATSIGARVFGAVVLVACVVVLTGGGWYFFGRDLFQDDDTASDDEPDEIEIGVDGGTRVVHRAGKKHGKGHVGSKGASAAHAHAGNYGPAGKSYEAAIAGNHEQISIGSANSAADLTDAQLGGPMRNASFVGGCGAPDSMHVTVKVAIRGGRAVGVSVYTAPPSSEIANCIDRAVRGLAWPVNGKMDSFVTTY